jgi:protein SCO1/2
MNPRVSRWSSVLCLALAMSSRAANAQVNVLPREMQNVGVIEHLNGQVPGDTTFLDENGHPVRLGQYFDGRRPVVLNLAYSRCATLCNMVLNAAVRGLQETTWSVGEEFVAITISIDPRETPRVASERRGRVLAQYNRPSAARGWHFLTGSESQIRRVADAVGFQYRYDRAQDQYAHPAVTMLLTPDGKVARYLYGIQYKPTDVRVGLLEASQGRSISTVERLILYCYHYDPQGQGYVLWAMRVMRLGGALTLLVFGSFLTVMWQRERRRRPPESHPPAAPTSAAA